MALSGYMRCPTSPMRPSVRRTSPGPPEAPAVETGYDGRVSTAASSVRDVPDLPDLRNLREAGGMETSDGRRVRAGALWRSGTVAFLDDAQVAALAAAGVHTRVDLRSPREVSEGTADALRVMDSLHLEVHAGGRRWDFDASHQAEWVAAHYAEFLVHSPESFVTLARLVGRRERQGVLVHCTAGKDRTGVAVALMLRAVGVRDEAVIADYARTEDAMPQLREQFQRLPSYQERLTDLPAEAFGSQPQAMQVFLASVRARYGGARRYLTEHGLTDAELAALEDALLED
ncbi:MAG: protein tyrosine phosphatase [Nocardioides sp.]|nr:protein tyrosine phosphatase [Nocardioides sp.]